MPRPGFELTSVQLHLFEGPEFRTLYRLSYRGRLTLKVLLTSSDISLLLCSWSETPLTVTDFSPIPFSTGVAGFRALDFRKPRDQDDRFFFFFGADLEQANLEIEVWIKESLTKRGN